MFRLEFSNKISIFPGEHIDYCGYSVFPMAIDQDIVSVFSSTDNSEVQISNTDPSFKYDNEIELFPNINFVVLFFRAGSFDIEKFSISYEKSVWYEYFKCGIQGIRDKYPDIKLKGTERKFRILKIEFFLQV